MANVSFIFNVVEPIEIELDEHKIITSTEDMLHALEVAPQRRLSCL